MFRKVFMFVAITMIIGKQLLLLHLFYFSHSKPPKELMGNKLTFWFILKANMNMVFLIHYLGLKCFT